MCVLGIDFGEQRIGLALSDPAATMAVPRGTLMRRSDRQATEEIGRLVEEEGIRELVVGEPLSEDGRPTEAAERVRRFGARLARATGRPVCYVDERHTSQEARRLLREAGVDLRRNRERIDAVAAQLLLQEELDRRSREALP